MEAKIIQKSIKNRMFLGTSIGIGFWEEFPEAKILDFEIFFAIFSKQNWKCNLERQQIQKKDSKNFYPVILAVRVALGGRVIRGGKPNLASI